MGGMGGRQVDVSAFSALRECKFGVWQWSLKFLLCSRKCRFISGPRLSSQVQNIRPLSTQLTGKNVFGLKLHA